MRLSGRLWSFHVLRVFCHVLSTLGRPAEGRMGERLLLTVLHMQLPIRGGNFKLEMHGSRVGFWSRRGFKRLACRPQFGKHDV